MSERRDCIRLEDLSALVDGELAPQDAARVRTHVAACAECAALLARLGGTSRLLQALPREPAGEELVRDVARRAAATASPRPRWTAWAAAAVAVLGTLVVLRVTREVEKAGPTAGSVLRDNAAPAAARAQDADGAAADAAIASNEAERQAASPGVRPSDSLGSAVATEQPAARRKAASELRQVPETTMPSEAPSEVVPIEAKRPSVDASIQVEDAPSAAGVAAIAPPAARPSPSPQLADAAMPPPPVPSEPARAKAEAAAGSGVEGGVVGGVLGGVVRGAGPDVGAPAHARDEADEDKSAGIRARLASRADSAAAAPGAKEQPTSPAFASPSGDAGEAIVSRRCDRPRGGADVPVEAGPSVEPPVLLRSVEPAWPGGTEPSRRITLRVIIEIDGSVSVCAVESDAGTRDVRAAIEAAEARRYRPASRAGAPQAVFAEILFGATPR